MYEFLSPSFLIGMLRTLVHVHRTCIPMLYEMIVLVDQLAKKIDSKHGTMNKFAMSLMKRKSNTKIIITAFKWRSNGNSKAQKIQQQQQQLQQKHFFHLPC